MSNQRVNLFIITVFVLTLVKFAVQTELYEGAICQLHTGEMGICKNSQNCKWLIQNLNKRKMKFADIRRCSFSHRNEEIVCCGDDRPNKPVEMPTSSISPCELGYIFDSYNCVPQVDNPTPTPPTPTPPVPNTPNQNKFSGSRINEACTKYSEYATELAINSIINGELALPTEFPHMVALGYADGKGGYDFDCGGSLVADRWVVTAAHCIKDRKKPVIVRMRKLDLYTNDDAIDAIDRPITKLIRHPQYINSRKKNDIALVEFEGNVDFNGDVHPACIRTDVSDVPETVELIIAGWGSIEADRTNRSKVLLKASQNIVPLDRCNQTLVEYNQLSNQPSLRALSESQLCAINRLTKSDACQGDSGGPIFFRDQSGMSTIHGIVSFGISCGTELPGIYTRIASYVDWIEETIWP